MAMAAPTPAVIVSNDGASQVDPSVRINADESLPGYLA
jgi:hypothetical protein